MVILPQIPVQPAPFEHGLPNLAKCIANFIGPVKIVALGSSTTAGERDIVAYPYRLEALFRGKYDRPMIDVINRGVGGQEAPVELSRLELDVFAEKPSLVIWQVGTNAIWQPPEQHPPSLDDTIAAVASGVDRVRAKGDIDIILMDPQYTPAMVTPAKINATGAMVTALGALARKKQVNLFRRFELMKAWHEIERFPLDVMVDRADPDRLHDSDWATQRLTRALFGLIIDAMANA